MLGVSIAMIMLCRKQMIHSKHSLSHHTAPYWCAKGTLAIATGACMINPNNIDLPGIYSKVSQYAGSGDIDPVSNMANDKVFLWHGTRDTTVVPGLNHLSRCFLCSLLVIICDTFCRNDFKGARILSKLHISCKYWGCGFYSIGPQYGKHSNWYQRWLHSHSIMSHLFDTFMS